MNIGTVDINGLACPVAAGGDMDLSISLTLPATVPSVRSIRRCACLRPCVSCVAAPAAAPLQGDYVFKMKATSGVDEVYCFQMAFTL